MYLSDVESGGETNFPLLNQTMITPKAGRALVFPNVLNEGTVQVLVFKECVKSSELYKSLVSHHYFVFFFVVSLDPMVSDKRMMHEALPVHQGLKFAANSCTSI